MKRYKNDDSQKSIYFLTFLNFLLTCILNPLHERQTSLYPVFHRRVVEFKDWNRPCTTSRHTTDPEPLITAFHGNVGKP